MQVLEPTLKPSGSGSEGEMAVLLSGLTALRNGDASVRLPLDWTGIAGRVADCFNGIAERNDRMARELSRLSQVVGKEGRLSQRGSVGDVHGFWRQSINSVNELIDDLVHPTSETARVIGAVAQGDLSQTMALEYDDRPLKGEFLRTAKTINKMVQQLGSFAADPPVPVDHRLRCRADWRVCQPDRQDPVRQHPAARHHAGHHRALAPPGPRWCLLRSCRSEWRRGARWLRESHGSPGAHAVRAPAPRA